MPRRNTRVKHSGWCGKILVRRPLRLHFYVPVLLSAMCLSISGPIESQEFTDKAETNESTTAIDAVADSTDASTATTSAVNSTTNQPATAATLSRLQFIQDVISAKLAERRELGDRIKSANEQDQPDLRREADTLSIEIRELRGTLEAIATGGADTSLFVSTPEAEESDWRQDIALIAQPVLDSLKELTEKPRRLKELNDRITLKQTEVGVARSALDQLNFATTLEPEGALGSSLQALITTWQKRHDNASSSIEIARIQIAGLQGDTSLPETIYDAVISFIRGRGLTLLIAAAAAVLVWAAVRFLLRGYRRTLADGNQQRSRTRYRLAAYSVHALTFLLIIIAIFVVFYERGDVLLLGILILLIVGLALSIRQLLPRYIQEARLLLNIGPMRESERIIFRELPWRVESINMYTVLRNPELHGVLRVPLADLQGISSRPVGKDSWFPTSLGDVVLYDDDLIEVKDQNPDTVDVRRRGGQVMSIPTTDFYAMAMTNLSRGAIFGVMHSFGIDYQHQAISTSEIPGKLREAIRESLERSDLRDFVKDVRVELEQAGSSSIDYWICVTMDSCAAKSYMRIKRIVQTALIETCTERNWGIPFPHVAVVRKPELQS